MSVEPHVKNLIHTIVWSKHIKGSTERYLLRQKHSLKIFGIIPFIKLQVTLKKQLNGGSNLVFYAQSAITVISERG